MSDIRQIFKKASGVRSGMNATCRDAGRELEALAEPAVEAVRSAMEALRVRCGFTGVRAMFYGGSVVLQAACWDEPASDRDWLPYHNALICARGADGVGGSPLRLALDEFEDELAGLGAAFGWSRLEIRVTGEGDAR